MKRGNKYTFFDAVTGVPVLLHYSEIMVIQWQSHPKLTFERANVTFSNKGTAELFMSREDANAVRDWMMSNGAMQATYTSAPAEDQTRAIRTASTPVHAYAVPVFAEKRDAERRQRDGTYIGPDKRQGDRRIGEDE